jgi:hypothetical protein
MNLTLSVVHIPASNETIVLVGVFVIPATTGGGGSPLQHQHTTGCAQVFPVFLQFNCAVLPHQPVAPPLS